ncbi:MAG TPA: DUF1292 domain-containing protein [Candidatus Cloacimonas sp.]|nr:DUF1292 domain-containing protein [Candidatus Cloacimonas sp.]
MSDTEKTKCNHNGDHICDEECECNDNFITLEMDDGTLKNFFIIGNLENEGKYYIALVAEGESNYDILQVTEEGDNVNLNYIDDDNEYNTIADKFDELYQKELKEMGIEEETE